MEGLREENISKKEGQIVQLNIGFEQIWGLIQQLSDGNRVELLGKLQAELEQQKLVEPLTNETQRKEAEQAALDEMMQQFIADAPDDNEEDSNLDDKMTTEELLAEIKNI